MPPRRVHFNSRHPPGQRLNGEHRQIHVFPLIRLLRARDRNPKDRLLGEHISTFRNRRLGDCLQRRVHCNSRRTRHVPKTGSTANPFSPLNSLLFVNTISNARDRNPKDRLLGEHISTVRNRRPGDCLHVDYISEADAIDTSRRPRPRRTHFHR